MQSALVICSTPFSLTRR